MESSSKDFKGKYKVLHYGVCKFESFISVSHSSTLILSSSLNSPSFFLALPYLLSKISPTIGIGMTGVRECYSRINEKDPLVIEILQTK